jgi:two-component system, OmpR family, sensor kinase
MPESVRARLALWHAATLGVLLIAFAAVAYAYTARSTLRRTDEYLRQSAGAFADALRDEREEVATNADAARETVKEIQFGTLQVTVLDAALRPIAASPPPAIAPGGEQGPPLDAAALAARLRRSPRRAPSLFTLDDAEGGYRVFVTPLVLQGEPMVLAMEQPLHDRQEALEEARAVLLVSIPLVLLVAWAGGYLLARRSLAPVVAMSERAARLSATNLDEALPVRNPRDELGRLALVFNDLLARLNQSIEQQRQFMADASHELRTPVSILRGEADIALSVDERAPAEYREALGVVSHEARRLSRIVDDLFLLARADAGQQPLRPGELYLDELAGECVRAVRSLAAQRGIDLSCHAPGDLPYRGDEPLLHRLLLNLLDNALKYSRRGGEVRLDLSRRDGGYVMRLKDAGPPIGAEAAERIFERFYRVDRARSREADSATGGAGLGLPIARWVAEAHGGSLRLARSTPEGNEFEVFLPMVNGAVPDKGESARLARPV